MRICSVLLAALLAVPVARADDAATTLETVVVSGAQPGPGMWKISKGDHVLWLLGTLRPLPRKMQWISRDVEATIAHSQEVVLGPAAQLDLSPLAALTLLPSLIGARNNPNGAKLADVLPSEVYARWQVQRERYLGRKRSVEKHRPIFAADELFDRAVEHAGLSNDGVVAPVVRKAAKRNKVPLTQPEVKLAIAEPTAAMKEFKRAPLDDLECFERTLDRVETDLGPMKARANAWASGDIEALRALPYVDQDEACERAILSAGVAQQRGLDDLKDRLRAVWLDAAEKAIAKNDSTFAALPIRAILDGDGVLAILRAKGYEVEAPE